MKQPGIPGAAAVSKCSHPRRPFAAAHHRQLPSASAPLPLVRRQQTVCLAPTLPPRLVLGIRFPRNYCPTRHAAPDALAKRSQCLTDRTCLNPKRK